MTFLGVLSDLFRAEKVTSIWVINFGHLEEAGAHTLKVNMASREKPSICENTSSPFLFIKKTHKNGDLFQLFML